jgi:L-aminopeptidase/D-esterase-like protein
VPRLPPRGPAGPSAETPILRFPAGYRIGHATDATRLTGCTVILPPPGTIAAVDVRGGAPGTRETGLFTPGNLVSEIDALVFAGGSAFGLAAATGVTEWLAERGAGRVVGPARVPIVSGAVLFDLGVGDPKAFPDAAMGRAACDAAAPADAGPLPRGRVGAAAGATVGKLLGIARAAEGGIGVASVTLPDGTLVSALAAVNAVGDVVDPDTGAVVAGPDAPGFRSERALLEDPLAESPFLGGHTTLVAVATSVPFEPGSLKRVAIEAHDGLARAVRPAHTLYDGDVVFALAPGGPPPSAPARFRVGAAAARVVADAILSAVRRP